jgi:AcrR family transcriptional regulator
VPSERRNEFRTWSVAATTPNQTDPEATREGGRKLQEFLGEHIAAKRAALAGETNPRTAPDILSAMIISRDADDGLSDEELVGMAFLLLVAGHETTVGLMGAMALGLWRHQDQRRLLLDDPSLIESAVEEFLRYKGSVQRSTFRIATEDVEIGGTLIPEGSTVTTLLGSANHDPAQFENPDELDITREPGRTSPSTRASTSAWAPRSPGTRRTSPSWAVFSILTSTAHYDVALPRPRMVRELADASKRVIAAPTPNASPGHEKHAIHRSPSARREQLIAGAAKAFRHSGYVGVSIDDIGGDAGVAGPALYRYFDTKADVLVAAVTRFYEWQALETTRALSTAPEPEQVIAALIEGYVRLAFTATDLLAVTLTERLYLPEDARERLDRIHADNTAEWQRWLLVARPDLRPPQAAVRVNVVKRIIDDCVRTPHLHKNPQFGEDLIQVALATLDLPEQAPAI